MFEQGMSLRDGHFVVIRPDPRRRAMKVRDVMRPSAKSIDGHETVQSAAERMKREDVGCLVVGDGRRSEGIVTDRDLSLRCIGDGRNASSTPVRDVMSIGVIDCREDEPVGVVIERMIDQGLLRLPVRNRKGQLVGLISARDSVRSVPMSKLSKRKALRVSFVKDIVSSQGQIHQVPVQNVYVTGPGDHDHAVAEAIERFQSDQRVQDWRLVADNLEIKEVL
jgi:CBS domain-containing protein